MGTRRKQKCPKLVFFSPYAHFVENDLKTDGKVRCLAENQNPSLHLYCTVNILVFLMFC
jgi:hypothetical protein